MDYLKIYQKICRKGKDRIKMPNDGLETHHIVPKSLGGSNSNENLTVLTAREHYICHRLLVKIYYHDDTKRRKMIYALWWMSKTRQFNDEKIVNSHSYEQARKMFLDEMPTKQKSHADRFRKNHAEGKYNYDYKKVSESLKTTLASLSKEEMTERMKNSVGNCDHEKRGQSIKKGKASKLKVTHQDGESEVFFSYNDVKKITGFTYSQIRYRIKAKGGLLENGKQVEYLERYKGNDARRKNSNS